MAQPSLQQLPPAFRQLIAAHAVQLGIGVRHGEQGQWRCASLDSRLELGQPIGVPGHDHGQIVRLAQHRPWIAAAEALPCRAAQYRSLQD